MSGRPATSSMTARYGKKDVQTKHGTTTTGQGRVPQKATQPTTNPALYGEKTDGRPVTQVKPLSPTEDDSEDDADSDEIENTEVNDTKHVQVKPMSVIHSGRGGDDHDGEVNDTKHDVQIKPLSVAHNDRVGDDHDGEEDEGVKHTPREQGESEDDDSDNESGKEDEEEKMYAQRRKIKVALLICGIIFLLGVCGVFVIAYEVRKIPSSVQSTTTPSAQPPCTSVVWGQWSECSLTCGEGGRFRVVNADSVKDCFLKDEVESELCPTKPPCPDDTISPIPTCEWGWSEWSSCSATCGTINKGRISVLLKNDSCNSTSYIEQEDFTTCVGLPACPVPCDVVWSQWSSCSATCGTAYRQRTQQFGVTPVGCVPLGPPPNITDADRNCNLTQCPLPTCPAAVWTQWTACSVTCGGGKRTRQNLANQTNCSTSTIPADSVSDCGNSTCPPSCAATEWSQWAGFCVCPFCANATKTRSRNILPNSPAGCVVNPKVNTSDTLKCYLTCTPDPGCKVMMLLNSARSIYVSGQPSDKTTNGSILATITREAFRIAYYPGLLFWTTCVGVRYTKLPFKGTIGTLAEGDKCKRAIAIDQNRSLIVYSEDGTGLWYMKLDGSSKKQILSSDVQILDIALDTTNQLMFFIEAITNHIYQRYKYIDDGIPYPGKVRAKSGSTLSTITLSSDGKTLYYLAKQASGKTKIVATSYPAGSNTPTSTTLITMDPDPSGIVISGDYLVFNDKTSGLLYFIPLTGTDCPVQYYSTYRTDIAHLILLPAGAQKDNLDQNNAAFSYLPSKILSAFLCFTYKFLLSRFCLNMA